MNYPNINTILSELEEKYPFINLAQPFAGLTGVPNYSSSGEINMPSLKVSSSVVADISSIIPELKSWNGDKYGTNNLSGGCADESVYTAVMKSIAEAIERYSITVIKKDEYIIASANELGDEAVDWRLFPKCTKQEYQNTNEILPFNPKKKIRWIKGFSLMSGKELYIPLSFTHITITTRQAEKFTLPISTGAAVHTDVYEALCRGLLEVVERDSIALTWLLKVAHPKIIFDKTLPKKFRARYASFNNSYIKQDLFDATTDLGIPVVYGIMSNMGHDSVQQVVTAASDLDPYGACAKAMREAVSTRMAVLAMDEVPNSPEECFKLEHGAVYMGHPNQRHEFDFLLKSPQEKSIASMVNPQITDSQKKLQWLVKQLRSKNIEAYAVELSTDEFKTHGLRSIKVFIPQLMPMSYMTFSKFLAHPRLYDYARYLGKKDFTADQANPLPQPFA